MFKVIKAGAGFIGCMVLCAGCVHNPDLKIPEAIAVNTFTTGSFPETTELGTGSAGKVQRFAIGMKVARAWWTLFQSEDLDKIVREALADNPSLVVADARVREARARLHERSGGVHWPEVLGSSGVSRQKVSPATQGFSGEGTAYNLHALGVSSTYDFDIFRRGKNELKGLSEQIVYQQFMVEGAYLSLATSIVNTVLAEALYRDELAAMQAIVASQEKQLALFEQQFDLGGIGKADVLAQRAHVQATRSEIPALEKRLMEVRHSLAVLTGKFPSQADQLPEFRLQALTLPDVLPVSVPSDLVRQRPDIRAAESLLNAAGAQVGVATADLYPRITLSAGLSTQSSQGQKLLDPETMGWNLGAGLVAPLFNGGRLKARQQAAVAAYEGALAEYQQIILKSFQEVADVLRSIESDAVILNARMLAEKTAGESLSIAQRQMEAGAINSLVLLNAEREYQQAHIAFLRAKVARYQDTVALFQVLGGGW